MASTGRRERMAEARRGEKPADNLRRECATGERDAAGDGDGRVT
jgi:hypothetical protein